MSSPLRLLILDPHDVPLLRTCLLQVPGSPFAISAFVDAARARESVAARHPDAIVLATQVGEQKGVEVLRSLRAMHCRSPVVMTGRGADEQTVVEVLRAGAADYVPKEKLAPERLHRTIRAAIESTRAQHLTAWQREQAEVSLREQRRRHDQLREACATLVDEFCSVLAGVRAFLSTFGDDSDLDDEQRRLLREALAGCDRVHERFGID